MKFRKDLKKNIEEFVIERIDENYRVLMKNESFLEKKQRLNNYIEEINQHCDIEKILDLQNSLHYQELQELYKQAIKDSINMIQIF